MFGPVLLAALEIAAQHSDALEKVEGTATIPLWVLLVAIGGVVGTLGSAIGIMWRNDQKKSERISGEFEKKDTSILDIATKIAEAVAKFVGAIDKSSDRIGTLITEVRSGNETVAVELRALAERVKELEGAVTRKDR